MLSKDIVRWAIVVCFAMFGAAFFLSSNVELWLATLATPLVCLWLLGGRRAQPALLWTLGISWLEVSAELLVADLSGHRLSETSLRSYGVQAAIGILCAIVVLALGMRLGQAIFRQRARAKPGPVEYGVNLNQAVTAFFASIVLIDVLYVLAGYAPVLRQPLIAFAALKFVCIYLVASTVFQRGSGYPALALVLLAEVALGTTGYFGTYKEAFFVVLIALATSGRRLPPRLWSFGVPVMLLVVWLSLFWTTVKPEYRDWLSGGTGEQTVTRSFGERLLWIGDKFLYEPIDYAEATATLLQRVAYVRPYAAVLAHTERTYVPDLHTYRAAVERVLMPRVLFPNKAAIDDSALTTTLTGWSINDQTSVSVGYVAEAHHDFGVPWMYLPILGIGVMMGAAARYFATRRVPSPVAQAFVVAGLFNAFQCGMNIDKALGGFLLQFIALALALKYIYPKFARWLSGRPRRRIPLAGASRASAYALRAGSDRARMDVRQPPIL
jgi:hypothetical protein